MGKFSGLTYQGTAILSAERIANSNYAWETNKKQEIALELGFLNNHVNVEISYYRNRSSNQLVGLPLPPSSGFTSIQANLPAIVQNTGFEFEVNGVILAKNNWQWSMGFNISIPKNKLVAYPGLSTSTNATTYLVGQPLGIIRHYNSIINPKTGLYISEDRNNNGILDDSDRYLSDFIGPKYYGGIQNSISFKGISLDFLISYNKQMGYNYTKTLASSPGYFLINNPTNNQLKDQLSAQKLTTTTAGFLAYLNASRESLAIGDASFMRLKNISLAYQLPTQLLSGINVTNIELFLQGQNVITLTNYKGLDPENQSVNILPPLRTFMAGLKFTF